MDKKRLFSKKQVLEVPNVINKYKKIVNIIFRKIFKREKIKIRSEKSVKFWQAEIQSFLLFIEFLTQFLHLRQLKYDVYKNIWK